MDYYKVLGINAASASQDDIKRAYRQCAKECHPDKRQNDPMATERMKQVNEAFETLSDPHKRFIYDAARSSNMGAGAFDGIDWNLIKSMIEKLVTCIPQMKKAANEKMAAAKKPKDAHKIPQCINIDLVTDMHEICCSDPPTKKIAVKVLRYDVNGRRCIKHTHLFIPLLNYKDEYVFYGKGDELSPGKFGDICVKLVIKPHECYHIDRILNQYDIHYEKTVTLYNYVYGLRENVKHIDGENEFTISYSGGDKVQVLKGMGIHYVDEKSGKRKRGDLYVMFDLQLPSPHSIINKDDDVTMNVISRLSKL